MSNNNTSSTVKADFPVVGMSCGKCLGRIDSAIKKQEGVISSSIDMAKAMASIEYNPQITSVEKLKQAVMDAGYDLVIN